MATAKGSQRARLRGDRRIVTSYYPERKRWWFRLPERGDKRHEVPAHHAAEAYMNAYLEAAEACGLDRSDGQAPIFRTLEGQWRSRCPSARRMNRRNAITMVKRAAPARRVSPLP